MSSSGESGEEMTVEAILDRRLKNGKREYLLKYEETDEPCWEPADMIPPGSKLLAEFEEKYKNRKSESEAKDQAVDQRAKKTAERKSSGKKQGSSAFDFDAEEEKSKPKGKGGKKKDMEPKAKPQKRKAKKDPNAPKRNLSAFFWFCNAERPKVREQNPELTLGGVAKELGRLWKEVKPEDKKTYESLARKDKQRYNKEVELYNKKKKAKIEEKAPEEDEQTDEVSGSEEEEGED